MAKSKKQEQPTDTYEPMSVRNPKADREAAIAASNAKAEREMWEEQQFLNGFRQIKGHKSTIGEEMQEINEVYKRLKNLGFTKPDVKWAMELEDKDSGEILATMQRRLRIAKMLGHGLARQIELFDKDRAPIEERAYEEGLAAGKLRKANSNPYDPGSDAGQAWQRGLNDGTTFINRELAGQFEGDELIKGSDADDDVFDDEAEVEAAE